MQLGLFIYPKKSFTLFQIVATGLPHSHEDHVFLHSRMPTGRQHKHAGVMGWHTLGHKSSIMLTEIGMNLGCACGADWQRV